MYAIFETGGKQYKVEEGSVIFVEKLDAKEDETVTFDKVLATVDGDNTNFGAPTLNGAKVTAKVVKQGKTKKIYVQSKILVTACLNPLCLRSVCRIFNHIHNQTRTELLHACNKKLCCLRVCLCKSLNQLRNIKLLHAGRILFKVVQQLAARCVFLKGGIEQAEYCIFKEQITV